MFAVMAVDMAEHQTRVYRFATWGDLPEPALREMRRAHELSNLLIEIEKAHEERVKELWAKAPTLQDLQEQVLILGEREEEIKKRGRKYRSEERVSTLSKELKKELKDARKELREVKKLIRDEKARIYPILKPELVKLGEQRQKAIKDTYRPAVDGGLYWANYNAVLDRHNFAVKTIRSRRKMGLPSNLRFRRWEGGEGTLTVQLQRQSGAPVRSPAVIADDKGRYHNVAQLTPALDPTHWATLTRAQQRKERMGTLRFRIGSGDEAGMVEMPTFIHRPIPPEADICFMEIKRTRLGRRYFNHVSVVARLPVTPMRTEGHKVAMHVGWRALGDGALRVAVVTGMTTPPPPSLDDAVRMHDGWAEIVIPARWRDQMAYVHSLSSIRGKNLDILKEWFTGWLNDHPDHGIVGIETIDKWRSPDRFYGLIERVAEENTLDAEVLAYLKAWRTQDIHVRETEDNLRAKIIARRNNAFCNVAAWLLDTAGLVAVDNYNIATLARKPDIGQDDNEAHRAARANRVLAAPGNLRRAMLDAASRRGVHVQPIDGTIAKIHHVCGQDLDQDERDVSAMVYCPTCDTMVDQDANALVLLQSRARDAAIPA